MKLTFKEKVALKGVTYLLERKGYKILSTKRGECSFCNAPIVIATVKKGEDEEIELDVCGFCMKENLNVSDEDVKQLEKEVKE
jgi:hypothetical protein